MSKSEEVKNCMVKCNADLCAEPVSCKGKGTKVWNAEGKVYLDFLAGFMPERGAFSPERLSSNQNRAKLTHVSKTCIITKFSETCPRNCQALRWAGNAFSAIPAPRLTRRRSNWPDYGAMTKASMA